MTARFRLLAAALNRAHRRTGAGSCSPAPEQTEPNNTAAAGHSDACVHPDQHDALQADYETLRAAVRAYTDELYNAPRRIDACGVREHLLAMTSPPAVTVTFEELRALDQQRERERREEAEAHRYRDQVNAPLPPSVVAALNERLRAGDVPVRKVRRCSPSASGLEKPGPEFKETAGSLNSGADDARRLVIVDLDHPTLLRDIATEIRGAWDAEQSGPDEHMAADAVWRMLAPCPPAPALVDLRQQYAEAARTVLAGAGPRTVDEWAELVADKVLAVRDAELERLIDHAADMEQRVIDLGQAQQRAECTEAAVERVRAIHQPVAGEADTQWCQVCSQDEEQPQPVGWWVPWPCPTIRALTDQPTQEATDV